MTGTHKIDFHSMFTITSVENFCHIFNLLPYHSKGKSNRHDFQTILRRLVIKEHKLVFLQVY